jgi:hypothetical protein
MAEDLTQLKVHWRVIQMVYHRVVLVAAMNRVKFPITYKYTLGDSPLPAGSELG